MPPSDVVSKVSPWTVAETVRRLSAAIEARGMTIFAIIDQRAAAEAVGMELRETVLVVFGNPAAGTPIMEKDPLAALDLPLKLLVWRDGDHTKVSYLEPAALGARYGIPAPLVKPLEGIGTLTDAVLSSTGRE